MEILNISLTPKTLCTLPIQSLSHFPPLPLSAPGNHEYAFCLYGLVLSFLELCRCGVRQQAVFCDIHIETYFATIIESYAISLIFLK